MIRSRSTSGVRRSGTDGRSWIVGVDSGGTFTDLVCVNRGSGDVLVAKVPSTPARPVAAVLDAVERSGLGPAIERLVHGTTVATNALLERKGARLALVTTGGFEDVPFIQRLNRRHAYDLFWQKPAPLVRRRHCIGVRERIDPHGIVVEALTDEQSARAVSAVRALAEADEIDAVAVCLLFSYVNDAHELELERRLKAELPALPVSISSRVSPLWREYERVSTVLSDAYVRPLMSRYLADLSGEVERRIGSFPVLILKSNGGTGAVTSVTPAPVTTLLSGLAGGAVGGAHFASAAGATLAVTFDMGGTSTDIGIVQHGDVRQLTDYEIEWGLPVVTPVVDVHAIGSGGGSIARVDQGGLLRVGPESAGADPGPACYGAGGEQPTVTDANVVLGRLNPDYFLGGEIPLDAAAARAAIGRVADPLGVDSAAAARSVVEIANENMANGIRLVTIERGIDPRDYTLVAFGGAGPLHACGVADAVGIRRILVPPHPGLCSAFGAAIAQLRVDRVRSLGTRAEATAEEALQRQFESMEADARDELDRDGARGRLVVRRSVECRYYLQNYEHEVTVSDQQPGFLSRIVDRFHELHRAFYGYSFVGDPVELVFCKVTVTERERVAPVTTETHSYAELAPAGERLVTVADGTTMVIPVFRRGRPTELLRGPLVIEETDSTVFVAEGWNAGGGPAECLILSREGAVE